VTKELADDSLLPTDIQVDSRHLENLPFVFEPGIHELHGAAVIARRQVIA
jgi:hypothetical protein